jgi:outer membrane lipoprotein-sorting protein
MAYFNNGYPATYQPMYQYQQPTQNQNQQTGIIWVSGEQAAKSYLIAPNSTVVLFDSEAQTIYLKSADASGMPNMKVLDYSVREPGKNSSNSPVNVANDNLSIYATKDEIQAVSAEITALRKRLDKLTKKEDDDE